MWEYVSVVSRSQDASGRWYLRVLMVKDGITQTFFMGFDDMPLEENYLDIGEDLEETLGLLEGAE